MPLLQSIVHRLDPSLDGERLTVTAAPASTPAANDDPVMASLVNSLNDTYNTKAKGWGRFAEQGEQAGPLVAWLRAYMAEEQDFTQLSIAIAE
ncbi:nucleoid-associated protein, partial [Halomonas sp. 3D7M]